MWRKFNDIVLKHGVTKPNFKGFKIDGVQAKWNVMQNVHEFGDLGVKMVDKD